MTGRHRDPRRGKARDLRRLGAGRLWDIFLRLHPEHDWRNFSRGGDWKALWHAADRAWAEWVRSATGRGEEALPRFYATAPPAQFRRDQNRLRRAREKQAIREQIARGDDIVPPRRRRDVRWLWW